MKDFEILAKQWEDAILSQEDTVLIVGGKCTNPEHASDNCMCNSDNCECGCRANNCNCTIPRSSTVTDNCKCGGNCNSHCGSDPTPAPHPTSV